MSESTAMIFMWVVLGVLAVFVSMALYHDLKDHVKHNQANEDFDEYQVQKKPFEGKRKT